MAFKLPEKKEGLIRLRNQLLKAAESASKSSTLPVELPELLNQAWLITNSVDINPEILDKLPQSARIDLSIKMSKIAASQLGIMITTPSLFEMLSHGDRKKPPSPDLQSDLKEASGNLEKAIKDPQKYGIDQKEALTIASKLLNNPNLDPKDKKNLDELINEVLEATKTVQSIEDLGFILSPEQKQIEEKLNTFINATDQGKDVQNEKLELAQVAGLSSILLSQKQNIISKTKVFVNKTYNLIYKQLLSKGGAAAAVAFLADKAVKTVARVASMTKRASQGSVGDLGLLGVFSAGFLIGGPIGATLMLFAISPRFRKIVIAGLFISLSLILTEIFIALLVIIISISIILFIINSGAYIVPQGSPLQGGELTQGIVASGTCPLVSSCPEITSGSYNPENETGHGSNSYWGFATNACTYSIPIVSMGGCLGPDPANGRNFCSSAPTRCSVYGYAADVVDCNGVYADVALPYLCDPGSETCSPLTWRFIDGWYNCQGASVPNKASCTREGWGYGAIFEAIGNGHIWRIYLNHINQLPSGRTYQSGSVIAQLANELVPGHLHIELNIDGFAVKPDFLCSGEGSGITSPVNTDLEGWYAAVNPENLVASNPLSGNEVGINSCTWMSAKNLSAAVNANFYLNANTPIGHAGFNGNFTNYPPDEGFSAYNFKTLVITESNQAQIISHSSLPDDLTGQGYKLAVTGVAYNNITGSGPKTAVGIKDDRVYLIILRSATAIQVQQFMESVLGVDDGFFLDSGASTTLCNSSGIVFSGQDPPRNIPSHIGITSGSFIKL